MTTFPFNPSIPASGNDPSDDQPLMQNNNNSTFLIVDVDHFGFRQTNGGTHRKVTLTNTANPAIPAGANAVFFGNLASGQSYPFWKNAAATYQLINADSAAANGYFTTATGIKFQWGIVVSASSTGSVVFPSAFTTACYNVQLTPTVSSSSNHASSDYVLNTPPVSTTGFTWYQADRASSQTGFFWMAIGK